jgi:hypothetical protein
MKAKNNSVRKTIDHRLKEVPTYSDTSRVPRTALGQAHDTEDVLNELDSLLLFLLQTIASGGLKNPRKPRRYTTLMQIYSILLILGAQNIIKFCPLALAPLLEPKSVIRGLSDLAGAMLACHVLADW